MTMSVVVMKCQPVVSPVTGTSVGENLVVGENHGNPRLVNATAAAATPTVVAT